MKSQLSNWISNALKQESTQVGSVRAIIAPYDYVSFFHQFLTFRRHAGYSYSGETAAYAYKYIPGSTIKRVFVFGPSHHIGFDGCGLPKLSLVNCETPLGDLQIDKDIVQTLYDTREFVSFDKNYDEDEHSLEMHYPFIKHVMGDREFTIVPIFVGSLKGNLGQVYGKIFAPYFQDEENFFVISSDFCHWGSRFGYTRYDENDGKIYESITKLDRLGMDAIETRNPTSFKNYLSEYKNTICGRGPITILLHTIQEATNDLTIKFVHYAQSSHCEKMKDSSVSYASGIVYLQ